LPYSHIPAGRDVDSDPSRPYLHFIDHVARPTATTVTMASIVSVAV
jgi:hypothetical protein